MRIILNFYSTIVKRYKIFSFLWIIILFIFRKKKREKSKSSLFIFKAIYLLIRIIKMKKNINFHGNLVSEFIQVWFKLIIISIDEWNSIFSYDFSPKVIIIFVVNFKPIFESNPLFFLLWFLFLFYYFTLFKKPFDRNNLLCLLPHQDF